MFLWMTMIKTPTMLLSEYKKKLEKRVTKKFLHSKERYELLRYINAYNEALYILLKSRT